MKNSDFIRGKNTGEFGFFFNYLIEFIEIEIDLINNDDGTPLCQTSCRLS